MGIYDREYYRGESGLSNWFGGVAPATRTLIVANIAVFIVQFATRSAPTVSDPSGMGWFTSTFSATSAGILQKFEVYRLFTAPFLHSTDNVLHIIWNMLFLWWFGREMESIQGSREYTLFYVIAGAVSTLGWALLDRVTPGGGSAYMIGASGATTAVAVLFTLFYPNREVLLFFVLPMRMWVLLAVFLGLDFLSLLQQFSGRPTQGVAFGSHLSGAGFAFLYRALNWRFTGLIERARRPRPRLRVVKPPVEREPARRPASIRPEAPRGVRPTVSPVVPEEQLDARLDEILAKIAREGRSALTDDEKIVLEEASRRARRRRSEKT